MSLSNGPSAQRHRWVFAGAGWVKRRSRGYGSHRGEPIHQVLPGKGFSIFVSCRSQIWRVNNQLGYTGEDVEHCWRPRLFCIG